MGSLYSEHLTWLHRLSPALKLVLMAVLSTALFMVHAPTIMLGCALACCVLWLSLGKATRVARRLILSVLVAALLIAAFHAYMGNYDLAIVSALRLACASTLGVALTVTTHPTHILQLLETLLAPLSRLGFPAQRFALQLALMMRFIEHFFVQWKRLDEAYRLRTGKAGGFRLLAPLSIQMLQTAKRVADALFARLGQ
ncbi:energy-coupling factor transporter transmembrane component T family protein [Comamonas sp. NoAH]|uniref:energy-coupling factor transporter transmembrane component T family protein n=1 Tax=Comamonas halotolerans TaxID=3041496 RepID=UPI0024E10806|nr:energy-coupling factor transporter transmembrane protein EcfT [Comamonas sp. NoAH]